MRHRIATAFLLLALGGLGGSALGATPARALPATPDGGAGIGTASAPAAARQEAGRSADTPDSLYRAGRAALNAGRYREAERVFGELVRAHPDWERAPDALYWRALALYRIGDDRDLREALRALERLDADYPSARTIGDASTLFTRIQGLLARSGDAEAAAEIVETAGRDESAETDVDSDADTERQEAVDADVRVAALNALLQMDSDRALPVLVGILRRCDDCSADLRRRALFMVAQQADDTTVVELLLESARSDPDPEVRRHAVFWLSEVDDARAVDALRDVLATPSDSALHERAAFALAQHDSREAAATLRNLARDASASAELRSRAVFWLGQQAQSTEFLRGLFGEVSDTDLKERILFSVAEGKGEAPRAWLLDVARDPSNSMSIRKKAVFWAGQADGPVGPLADLFGTLDERELKEQVVFSVAQSEAEGSTEWLIEIARSEDDPEIRKKAVFWLGQSDDPRAVDVLTEIIGSGGGP